MTDVIDGITSTREVIIRVFIDNNTYPTLPGTATTDAIRTRLRFALPSAPVYEAHPTAYLAASNARPSLIYDTVTVRARRPMRLRYVPGSTVLERSDTSGRLGPRRLPDGVASENGLMLGDWRADFANAGYVTFRVRIELLDEPVRDPRAAPAMAGGVVYSPPSRTGLSDDHSTLQACCSGRSLRYAGGGRVLP